MSNDKLRVMWLLNHTTARKYEVGMMKRIGVDEIFLPKIIPNEIDFRSGSLDYSEDANLTIPADELEVLNATNWYENPSKNAWAIANKYFQVAFFILYNTDLLSSIAQNFKGAAIWRVYGLDASLSYSAILKGYCNEFSHRYLTQLGRRFWFGQAYPHLHVIEENELLKNRQLYLPLGLHDISHKDDWVGERKKIYFVCPELRYNGYYQQQYKEFVKNFAEFDYSIAGMQSLPVADSNVLGYVSPIEYANNMRDYRVMFYQSAEPNHIHYNPFEAIRAGMPLVYMAGGLLDKMGGLNLPGRCENIAEARAKIRRIMNDDWSLIAAIRKSQVCLLEAMAPEKGEQAWRDGLRRILAELKHAQLPRPQAVAHTRKRIAVILPAIYRGGTLRGAKLFAQALWEGSRQMGEDADVVFAHLDDPAVYADHDFDDLHPAISRRSFCWQEVNEEVAQRAMRYAGYYWKPEAKKYLLLDDGMWGFCDCDLWVFISDRISAQLVTLRPYVCMVYDYLSRYEKICQRGEEQPWLHVARHAERVLTTTKFTQQDAIQYAGVRPEKVKKLPMLPPLFSAHRRNKQPDAGTYFLWTTNAAPHKNHENAIAALVDYYLVLEGKLDCRICGVNVSVLAKHLQATLTDMQLIPDRLRWLGELKDASYQSQLANAAFLWHPGRVDNGTFSVIEAANFGVPALSSDYPAMREIDEQFTINLTWMDSSNPKQMAKQLKWMEENYHSLSAALPEQHKINNNRVEHVAADYWGVIRECL